MSFDRVADIYDATRGLPAGVPEAIADRVLDITRSRPDAAFLELGVGSGRIALPFVARGTRYTGVDISERMMEKLRAKLPANARLDLRQAEITNLPFPDQTFDVVLAVHVLHLVPEWRKVLAEARRVLKPGGWFIMGHDRSLPDTPARNIRRQWRVFSTEEGAEPTPELGNWEVVEAELTESGGYSALWQVAEWVTETAPAEIIELMHARTFSASWAIPDAILDATNKRMTEWARETYDDPNIPLPSTEEFILSATRWP